MSQVSNAQQSPPEPSKKGFYGGIATGLGVVVAALTLMPSLTNFKIVDTTAYISVRDLSAGYYTKEFVGDHYVAKTDISKSYISKEDAEKQVAKMVPPERIEKDYVPRAQYDTLKKTADDLQARLDGIPTPFPTRTKKISKYEGWVDRQLGIEIAVHSLFYSDKKESVSIVLSLPDAKPRIEELDKIELKEHRWTFYKNNREFELRAESLKPIVFSVREILSENG